MLSGIVLATILTRCGLLALVVTLTLVMALSNLPLTVDPSSWYFRNAVFFALFVLALTAWGLRAALAGRSLLREEV
jgi:NADH:ubiquinone oxidoreductase subunit K